MKIQRKQKMIPKKVEGYIYFIKEFHTNTYKIGKAKNIENRLRLFGVKLPFKWELIHSIKSFDYSLAEKEFHKLFKEKRIKGTEWFHLTQEDIENIKANRFNMEINSLLKIKEEVCS
ncbi:GIY-YIG nuclease family protein [Niallia taxi]|uniref:GIY-YIG nuclease family protein n=1 Tax=Niallia taxi TaxID=2499688 RepID=UPI00316D3237